MSTTWSYISSVFQIWYSKMCVTLNLLSERDAQSHEQSLLFKPGRHNPWQLRNLEHGLAIFGAFQSQIYSSLLTTCDFVMEYWPVPRNFNWLSGTLDAFGDLSGFNFYCVWNIYHKRLKLMCRTLVQFYHTRVMIGTDVTTPWLQ